MRRVARGLVAVLALLVAGCADAFFFDPAPGGAGTIALRWEASLSGPGEAFDQADNVRLRLTDPATQGTVADEEVPFQGEGSVSIAVELEDDSRSLHLDVEVRTGTSILFRASREVLLRNGETTTATVQLEPVAAAVEPPPDLPTLTSYGDSLSLQAAAVFATGDTLPDAVPSWSTLDPQVVEVGQRPDGRWFAVARSDGTARLRASFDGLDADVTAEVHAEVVAVEVSPPSVTVQVDAEVELAAVPRDARNNDIPGRPATWTSENPSVASVDGGLVRGESAGNTTVFAEVDGVAGSAEVTVSPGRPTVETRPAGAVADGQARLEGSVNPNGSATQAWFEWGTDPQLANAAQTAPEAVGAGEQPVDVDAVVDALPPATTFHFRAVAANAAGETRGAILSFTTPTAPAVPTDLRLTYDGGVYVRWSDNSGDEERFEIERAVSSPGTAPGAAQQAGFEPLAVVGAGVEEYFDGGAPPGTVLYRVRACSPVWCSDYTPPESIDVPAPPAVTTSPPSEITPSSARLAGTADPMGSRTFAWFEWDDHPDLLSPATTPAVDLGSGSGAQAFDALVENLSAGVTYYYRATASNDAGTATGGIRSFTTPVPPATPEKVDADYADPGIDVFWQDVSTNEDFFEIQRELVTFAAGGAAGSGPLPVFLDIGTAPADATRFNDPDPPFGLLRYRVRACNQVACSEWSVPVEIPFGN